MRTFKNIHTGDVIHADGVVADFYARQRGWREAGVRTGPTPEVPLSRFTVPQLKEYAAASGVELGGVSAKADIITKIEES